MIRVGPGAVALNVRFPHSEVCMHLRVAGLIGHAQLVGSVEAPMVQLLDLDLRPISFPVTPGEAGFYRDDKGWYVWPAEVEEPTAVDVERHGCMRLTDDDYAGNR